MLPLRDLAWRICVRAAHTVRPVVVLAAFSGLACGVGVDLGGPIDSGVVKEAATCAALASPDASAPCEACDKGKSGCQPNGCFNGYLCDIKERDCKVPDASCSDPDGDDER